MYNIFIDVKLIRKTYHIPLQNTYQISQSHSQFEI
jgi:hypothetical protein